MRQSFLPSTVEHDSFVPRGDTIDFEADATGFSAGTIWVRMLGQWLGFVMFYDFQNRQLFERRSQQVRGQAGPGSQFQNV